FYHSWNELIQSIEKENVDIVFAIQKTKERKEFLEFTHPYLIFENYIIVRQGNDISLESLNTKSFKVAAVQNSAVYNFLKKTYPDLNLIPVKDDLNALALVSAGEVDLSICEYSRISYYFRKELFQNLKIGDKINYKYEFRIGVLKRHVIFKNILDKALLDFSEEEKASIINPWIEIKEKKFYEDKDFLISFIIFLGVLTVAVTIFFNISLKRLVEQRTKELTESEKRQKIAKERAEEGARAKSDFIAIMSHEIKTPLNSILGFAELLKGLELEESSKKYVNSIQNSAESLLSLVEDILEYSDLERNNVIIKPEPIAFLEFLRIVIENFSFEANQKKIELLLFVFPDIPEFLLIDIKIKKVLIHLLGNAIKFTEKGFVCLKVHLVQKKQETKEVRLKFEFIDTGIGINDLQKENIFSIFSQGDTSLSRKFKGIGIGLTISRKILELFKSKIEIDSKLNEGSNFSFEINFEFENSDKIKINPFKNNIKILTINMNVFLLEYLEEILSFYGAELNKINSYEEGLKELSKNTYDLMLLDDKHNNILEESILEFRKINRKLPILLCMSSFSLESLVKIKNSNENISIVEKPFTYKAIWEEINLLLDNSTAKFEPNLEVVEVISKSNSGEIIKILLVDDDPVNLFLEKNIMQMVYPGVEIIEAVNGEDAISKLSFSPDFIFMDIQMPIMNGLDATIKIRTIEKFKNTPIIGVSAGIINQEVERCFNAGMNDFISKPCRKEDFERILNTWLN
ncbi:MAG: response regulator, partial [Leptospiraceae bacterium]|nr:response regulator [Leptospiraceae bacterium]